MIATNLPVSYADILSAARTLEGIAHRTPVMTSRQADARAGARVFFKCENFQRGGTFKFRGAYNAISRLDDERKRKGVVTFSSGNHGQAVALTARILGIAAIVVMPGDAPQAKIAATREYGAEVIFYNRVGEDRAAIASRLVEERGATLIPPFDHRDIIAGQGTAAKELLEDVGPLDFLFACVGGGGLLSGSVLAAAELAPTCKVIGVEPQAANRAQRSLRSGEIVTIAPPETIADGARTQRIGDLTFPILRAGVHDIVTVSDEQLRDQMRFFAERMKIIVEPTGSLAAAAVLNRIIDSAGPRIGVLISGGNVDGAV